MYECVRAGSIVWEESAETLSDGTAGGVEDGAVTLALCRDAVDDWILVDEARIAEGVFYMMKEHHKVGWGGVGWNLEVGWRCEGKSELGF